MNLQDAGQMYMETNAETILFSPVLKESEDRRKYVDRLLGDLGKSNFFNNEFYVLYTLIHDNPRVTLSEPFIKLWLQANRAIVSSNRENINFAQYKLGDNDEYAEFMTSVINTYHECIKHEISEEDFETSLTMIKMEYVNKQSITMLQNAVKALTEGLVVNRTNFAGFEGMRTYVSRELMNIDKVASRSPHEGLVVYDETLVESDEDASLPFITDFGIPAVDEAMGGIYGGDMVGILAPPKGFKTRLSAYLVHRTLVEHGNSVGVIPIENGRKGFESLIRAAHFNWYYNRDITDPKKKRIMNSDWIRKNKIPEELKELEAASYHDFKTNPRYGRLVVISEAFSVESFVDNIERAVKENNIRLILIDYLQLITAEGNVQKNQRIGMAYQALLAYLKMDNALAGLVPGQIKQEKVNELSKNSDELADAELRDAGGESAEVIRTPDINLLIYGTMQDIKRGRMQLVGLPSRNFQGFDPVKMHADAGVCDFYAVPDEVW